MLFKGKTAIITGANSGIGHECAMRFLDEGALGAGVDINTGNMSDLTAAASEHGTQFEAYQCDVRDEPAVKALVESVVQKFAGRIDVMLNVAGITVDTPVTRTDKSVFDRVMDVNAGGTFNFCKHAAVYMKKQRSGVIVNTSSVTAEYGTQMGAPYSASKAAILGITRSLAIELAPWGIRVNAVAPGVINTEMVAGLNALERRSFEKSIPLGRLGEAGDIASAMLFLAGDGAAYITGATLNVDGGYRPGFVSMD